MYVRVGDCAVLRACHHTVRVHSRTPAGWTRQCAARHVGKLELKVTMVEVAFVTFNVRNVHVTAQGIGAADVSIGIAYLGA